MAWPSPAKQTGWQPSPACAAQRLQVGVDQHCQVDTAAQLVLAFGGAHARGLPVRLSTGMSTLWGEMTSHKYLGLPAGHGRVHLHSAAQQEPVQRRSLPDSGASCVPIINACSHSGLCCAQERPLPNPRGFMQRILANRCGCDGLQRVLPWVVD